MQQCCCSVPMQEGASCACRGGLGLLPSGHMNVCAAHTFSCGECRKGIWRRWAAVAQGQYCSVPENLCPQAPGVTPCALVRTPYAPSSPSELVVGGVNTTEPPDSES